MSTGHSAARVALRPASSGPAGVCEDPCRGAVRGLAVGMRTAAEAGGGNLARSPHLCGRPRPNCLPERDWMGASVHGSTGCGSW